MSGAVSVLTRSAGIGRIRVRMRTRAPSHTLADRWSAATPATLGSLISSRSRASRATLGSLAWRAKPPPEVFRQAEHAGEAAQPNKRKTCGVLWYTVRMSIHYLAGLVDGEGCFQLASQGGNRPRQPLLVIGMTDSEPIEWAHANFGGFIKTQPRRTSNWQDMHYWMVKGTPALSVMQELRPHLVIPRRRLIAGLLVDQFPAHSHKTTRLGARQRREQIEELFRTISEINKIRSASLPTLASVAPTEGDLGYLAGILDGEGWVGDSDYGSPIQVFSTDPELPAWLASRFGGRAYTTKRKSETRAGHRKTYSWRLSKLPSRDLAEQLIPLVNLERKREALTHLAQAKSAQMPTSNRRGVAE